MGANSEGHPPTTGNSNISRTNPFLIPFEEIHNNGPQSSSNVSTPKKLSFSDDLPRYKFPSSKKSSLCEELPKNKFPSARISSFSSSSSPPTDEIAIFLNKFKSKRAVLNVGGDRHEILWSTLEKFPGTKLGRLRFCRSQEAMQEICDDYSLEHNEYYFDRNSKSFSSILNLYRMGRLHIPQDFCIVEFSNEMNYWEISEMHLDECCHLKYQQKKELLHHDAHMKKSIDSGVNHLGEEEVYSLDDFGSGCSAKYRKSIWDLFERPDYLPARVMAAISVFFIIISVTTFLLSTMKEFQNVSCKHINKTLCKYQLEAVEALVASGVESPDAYKEFTITKSYFLVRSEQVCMIFFTLEYLFRFISCPYKKRFLKSWHNFIDLVSILPYYLSQILILVNTVPIKDMQVLLIFRVIRIFKLARHSTGLQSLGYTFRRSYQDLGVLLLFLSVGVVIFSSLLYFAEKDVNKSFSSIPTTFWWALITMTTVGYGDAVPVTLLGKIVGMVTATCGCLFVALPIAFTMNTFGEFYEKQKQREKLIRRRKTLSWVNS